MAVICVAGIAPGIGKTAVAELLLGELAGWHVARVRVAHEVPDAEAARLAERGYALLVGAEEMRSDPDVGRLLRAGAKAAALLLAEPRGLHAGLRALEAWLPAGTSLLVEGNAFLWARDADLAIMVVGAGPSGKGLARVRPAVQELVAKVGMWVWNARQSPADEGFFEFPQAMARMGLGGAISIRADFHHVNPAQARHSGNAPFLEAVRRHMETHRLRRDSDEFLRRIGFDRTGQT